MSHRHKTKSQGGKKWREEKLCQGEASMGSRKAPFAVIFGEGRADQECGSRGRGRHNLKLGSNKAKSLCKRRPGAGKGFQEHWARATGMQFNTR